MTRAIIPVKRLNEAKSTFQETLSQEQRRELVLCMLEDILQAISQVEEINPVVVTPDEEVLNFVRNLDFEAIPEPDMGLNRALEMIIEKSIKSGVQEIIYIPGDVPLMKPDDLENILSRVSGNQSVVITPSNENGTNALFLRPPDVIDLHFGGKSFPKHLKEARDQGADLQIYHSNRLERDIDSPEHFLKVETLGKGTRTHSFLDSLKE